jgi:hypothetical protein
VRAATSDRRRCRRQPAEERPKQKRVNSASENQADHDGDERPREAYRQRRVQMAERVEQRCLPDGAKNQQRQRRSAITPRGENERQDQRGVAEQELLEARAGGHDRIEKSTRFQLERRDADAGIVARAHDNERQQGQREDANRDLRQVDRLRRQPVQRRLRFRDGDAPRPARTGAQTEAINRRDQQRRHDCGRRAARQPPRSRRR